MPALPADARQPPAEDSTRVTRALLLALGGALCLAQIRIAGLTDTGYEILYGRHGWAPGEIAFMLHYLLFGIPAAALLGGALALGLGDRLSAGFDRLAALPSRTAWRLAGGAAAAAFLLIALVRLGIFRDTAITDDENVYAFMAQVFASGRLFLPSLPEPVRPFFDNQFIVNDSKWYGIYFPGYPAALALGEWLHAARWVPGLSATLTVPLTFAVGRRAFGQRAALLALPLLVLSPFFVFSSATLLAHAWAGLLFMGFVYAALRIAAAPDAVGWWLLAALALGWAALTRPLSAVAFALPWLGWLGWRLWRDRSGRTGAGAIVFCLVGAVTLGLFGGYNLALSGSPLVTSYHTFARINNFAFTVGALAAPPPLPSLHELGYTLARLNFWLLGWPVSLALLPFFRRATEGVLLALGTAAVLLAYALSAVPTINVVGPVHYAELAPSLILLGASGLERVVERARAAAPAPGRERLLLGLPLGATLVMLVTFIPIYGASLRAMADVARAPYALAAERGLDRAVVFVHSLPALHRRPFAWVYTHRNSSPGLQDRILFVRYLGAEKNKDLMRYLPDRKPYAMGMRGGDLLLVPVEP